MLEDELSSDMVGLYLLVQHTCTDTRRTESPKYVIIIYMRYGLTPIAPGCHLRCTSFMQTHSEPTDIQLLTITATSIEYITRRNQFEQTSTDIPQTLQTDIAAPREEYRGTPSSQSSAMR
jgi:hypothetical protein